MGLCFIVASGLERKEQQMRLILLLAAVLTFQSSYASEIDELLLKAEAGDAEAMFQAALFLEKSLTKTEGKSANVDILVNPWYESDTKTLTPKNNDTEWRKIENWYLKAAESGNFKAMVKLGEGVNHESGGFERDISWLVEAAASNYAPAQFKLGINYLQGQVLKDTPTAHKWLKKASDNGYADASAVLGNTLSDEGESLEYLKKAYDQGRRPTSLAIAAKLVTSPNKDLVEAQSWSKKYISFISDSNSTTKKEGDLAFHVASKLGDGLKVTNSNLKTIISLYEVSASARNTSAMKALGDIFADKRNGFRNNPKALMWYNLAAKRGNKKAAKKQKRLAKKASKSDVEAAKNAAKKCRRNSYTNCGSIG